jgi:DNA polymerase-3 subunit beta
MTTQPLLTIGGFARAVGLPTSALRHYDEVGLLSPAETDPATGYRYYTPDLEHRARLVALMRDVGVSIETMRIVLDGDPEEALAVLREVAADRAEHAQRTREVIDTVLALADRARSLEVARLRVGAREMGAALRQVRPAADRDPASALAAVALDAGAGTLDVVATNRYWMACRSMPVGTDPSGPARAVLRLAEADRLADRLDGLDEVVLVVTSEGRLSVEVDDDLIGVETSDRPFPAHRLVLEGVPDPTTRLLVERDAIERALTEAARSVVTLALADERLHVEGRAVDALVRGKPGTIAMRTALLLRALAACVGGRVLLEVAGAADAVRVSSPDQPGFVALVMPTHDEQ